MPEPKPDEEPGESQRKGSRIPLILGLFLAAAGGGGGYYATSSGLIFASSDSHSAKSAASGSETSMFSDIAFVEVDPITVSMRSGGSSRHLRFRAQLEVKKSAEADVRILLPRVVDVLNSYLSAIELADIEDASALARVRSQMLRRVQVVLGDARVNDLLIMEFVVT